MNADQRWRTELSQSLAVSSIGMLASDDFSSPIIRGMARRKQVARDHILNDDELRAVWRATSLLVGGLACVRRLRPLSLANLSTKE